MIWIRTLTIIGSIIIILSLGIIILIKIVFKKQPPSTKQTLGDRIKMYRTQSNMTQEYLAQALGVSRQAVSKWEKGVSEPSTANLLELAKIFNISSADLLKNIE